MRERNEALALIGVPALSYKKVEQLPHEDRRVQEDRMRSLERLKIRVEEAGGSGEDVRTGIYRCVVEREAFLAKELEDLRSQRLASRTHQGLGRRTQQEFCRRSA